MKRLLPVLALFAVLCGCCSCGRVIPTDGEVAVVPLPEHIVEGQGTFRLTSDAEVVLLFDDERLSGVTAALNKVLMPLFGRGPRGRHADKAADHAVNVTRDETMPAEAYRLFVTPCRIDIVAGGAQGVFYAVQTLRQLLPAAAYEADDMRAVELPVVTIEDKPCLGYRGMMLDVGRHFFTVDEVKEALDIMALHKLNVFHWHLTDDQGWRIEIRKYPKLTEIGSVRSRTLIGRDPGGTYDENCKFDETPYGGYYTQDEIRDVVNYAAERFITVIPEIEFPGHAVGALASYPWLGCTGEQYEVRQTWDIDDRVFCIGKETTFEFIEGVLEEVLELFPSEYIHIGGDECPKVRWEKCPRCQAKIRQLGLKDDGEHTAEHYLQSYVTDRIGKFLAQHGRRIIGWDEILEGRAPSDAVVMSWRGSEGGIAAAKLGHDVIMTPNSHFYFDYYQSLDTDAEPFGIGGYIPMEQVYSYDPAFPELTPEQQKHILGVQANLWTEYVLSDEHLEYMLLPRLAALSEVQWCLPETKDWNRFIGSFRMDEIYSQMGYEFAKHIFGVTASYAVDPEKGGVVMTLTTQGGAPIRYTLDGSDPTASSPLYKAPVTIGESCTFKAAALREGMQTPVYARKFDFNKATGRRIALNAAPTLKYTYGGASLLVDGYRGGPVYSNGAWIGFLNEPLDVTIDMQGAKPYSAVTVESLVEKGEWVFPPSSVGVYLSDDGSEFTEAALMSVPQETAGSPDGVKPFKVLFPETSARYLRVVARTVDPIPAWHGAAGQKAHMFVDEIIVE